MHSTAYIFADRDEKHQDLNTLEAVDPKYKTAKVSTLKAISESSEFSPFLPLRPLASNILSSGQRPPCRDAQNLNAHEDQV